MNDPAARELLIALSSLPFLTPNRTRLLLEYFDPVTAACRASATLLQGLLRIDAAQAALIQSPPKPRLASEVITIYDATYPRMLREIIDPPLVLHYRGDLELLQKPGIAIVGSRKASPYGINVSSHLARQLAGTGLTITSGLARGVDSAAHQAALDAGGTTIGVLGTGIDLVYPRSNARLFRRLAEHGLIVTEFPPGTPPKPEHFPIRNRVISGLTYGTVIVEATSRSGSLITARMAAEQGREVFAVPSSIFSAGSEGPHRLVQYGAKLVHDATDVIDELPEELRRSLAQPAKAEDEPESPLREVLAALNHDEGIHVDTLTARTGRTAGAIAESLLQLELGGWVRALPGARYVRAK
jgi:DNA processing protein